MKQEKKSRVKMTETQALEYLDNILESRSEMDFVGVVGRKAVT